MRLLKSLAICLPALLAPVAALGHEFWIEPQEFQPPNGASVIADFRNGEEFKGPSQSYISQRSRRLDGALGDDITAINPRMGDRPAISIAPEGEGLLVLIHATADSIITYREIEKFEAFVRHKDAVHALEAQVEEVWPADGLREAYSRYAKSLVALGDGAGSDREFGLLTELVALENPYSGDVSDGLDVALFYAGQPRSSAQIEVFERAPDTSVKVSLVQTDDLGRATIPVRPGHVYMLDAVVLRRPTAELAAERNVLWESLWANLTFLVPE